MLGSMDPPPAEKELKDLGTKARKSKPERSPNCLCCAGDQPEKRMKISSSEDTDVNTDTRLKALGSTDLYESSEGENGPADGDDKVRPIVFVQKRPTVYYKLMKPAFSSRFCSLS